MNLSNRVVMVATAPIRSEATTIGYHMASRLIFVVSTINFAISAWIFSSSTVVILLRFIVLPYQECQAAAIPLPYVFHRNTFVFNMNSYYVKYIKKIIKIYKHFKESTLINN